MSKTLAFSIAALIVFSGCTIGNSNQDNSSANTNQSTTEETNAGSEQSVTVEPGQGTSSAITLSEVKKHASENDCWMAVDGKVYDVTKFITDHPGGNVITQGCGKDASALFTKEHGPHVETARAALPPYEIGTLQN